MPTYITDRFFPDENKANGLSSEGGPDIEANDLEHAQDMAESYEVVIVGIRHECELEKTNCYE